MAFNPSGLVLAVGSRDSVFLIDPLTVKEIARIPHAGAVTGVSFSAEGDTLATASLKVVQFWDATRILAQGIKQDDLVASACSRLTSNFSQAQWSNLFRDLEYVKLCEGLPVP
jgi:WD40 repeat protein